MVQEAESQAAWLNSSVIIHNNSHEGYSDGVGVGRRNDAAGRMASSPFEFSRIDGNSVLGMDGGAWQTLSGRGI